MERLPVLNDFTDLPETEMADALLIEEVTAEKDSYEDLLLIGDEQPEMIERYIGRSRLFIGYLKGVPVSCIAVTEESLQLVEIRNLAVIQDFRNRGIGKAMLHYAESLYPGRIIQLGTGETPSTLRFYKNCGYDYSHTVPDFFTDNYDHPIIEEGVVLKDMIYLRKKMPL